MDNRRMFLLAALGLVGYLIFNAWMQDYGPKAPPVQSQQQTATSANAAPSSSMIPEPAAPAAGAATPAANAKIVGAAPLAHGRDVTVETDTMRVTLDTAGGDVRRVSLLQYPQTQEPSSPPVELLTPEPSHRLVLQTGLRGLTPSDQPPVFQVSAASYTLKAGQDELRVPLTWRGNGVIVTKIYTFHRGNYQVDLDYRITNASGQPLKLAPYAQFRSHYVPQSHSLFSLSRYMYTGPAIFNGEDYKKLNYDELAQDPFSATTAGGWTAMVNQYFLAAVIPPQAMPAHYYAQQISGPRYRSGLVLPEITVAPGADGQVSERLFLGPKLQDRLGDVAPGLGRTVDYGKVTIIAQPMYKVLEAIHWAVGNWGWSIILLVFLIKLVFFPLSQRAGQSMAKMREFQPRIKAIQERYKDDRQRQSQAMMELYKKEKINPMGGCLPMLLQLPIYFGLYYVLLYSVELRQAPFVFWLTDLSAPDPYYVLPILYGIAQFVQMRVNPQPADKMQARIMMIMPLGALAFAIIMPAGLVVYWVTNAILTALQQWHINKVLHQPKRKKR
ncbi:MAG TPA: membrane protein insertase YidC [Gammaproteobacteria bacterium]|nr:membrane protein insertase YidC [Gammaproteobacteria bacterium]HET7587383.1 membrane protein insertase YidC [Gammaproteobacteria bacterium]